MFLTDSAMKDSGVYSTKETIFIFTQNVNMHIAALISTELEIKTPEHVYKKYEIHKLLI